MLSLEGLKLVVERLLAGSSRGMTVESLRSVIVAGGGDVPLVVELRAGGFADLNVMRPVMLGQPCFLRVAPAGR